MNRKSIFKTVLFALAVLIATGFTSCEKDGGGKDGGDDDEWDERYEQIINHYINTTVVPTYKNLAEAALEMRKINNAMLEKIENAEKITDSEMQEAADAWMKTRIQWELSEAFLFGPVGEQAYNIDAHIDEWPLDLNEIEKKLDQIKNGETDASGEEIWEWDEDIIGFHVIEYFIFEDGKARKATDVKPEELKYMTGATEALVWDCVMAYIAWVGMDNATSEMRTVFNENPEVVALYNDKPNYQNFASKMKPISENGNYPSWKDAVAEIGGGASEIAEEVGSTKIESPYQMGSVHDVESWNSRHSLDDYENNILSIKNAYLGVIGSTLASNTSNTLSLSALIEELDSDLNKKILEKINECITKIRAIGTGNRSFYEVVSAKNGGSTMYDDVVADAVDACLELRDLFDQIEEVLE